jgi:hypothetical protein
VRAAPKFALPTVNSPLYVGDTGDETQLQHDARPLGWGWLYGSGGGVSQIFQRPFYQAPQRQRTRHS